jgi:hypothetical protein
MSEKKKAISFDDFVAYRPMGNYIFLSTREPWPARSVDAELPPVALLDAKGRPVLDKKTGQPKFVAAHAWLDKHRPAHQMTWAPGAEMLIRDKVVAEGGWIDKQGTICLNLYRPPTIAGGDARKVKPWLDHVHRVYPTDASHIIYWLAHRVQRPADKINHALMFGGAQGIGKDTLLEPVKHAVGKWNFAEVSPTQMLGRFNGFLKSVILRVSEARDLGDSNRFTAYDHMKTYTAAPPDTLRVDEKHLREHYVLNCCGVIITTNYKTEGIYLPRSQALRRLVRPDQGRLQPGLLEEDLGLVRPRRHRERHRLPHQAQYQCIRCQGAVAEDRSFLGDRQCQPRARRGRACRHPG